MQKPKMTSWFLRLARMSNREFIALVLRQMPAMTLATFIAGALAGVAGCVPAFVK